MQIKEHFLEKKKADLKGALQWRLRKRLSSELGPHESITASRDRPEQQRNGWGTGGIEERRSTGISEEVPLFPTEQIYDE